MSNDWHCQIQGTVYGPLTAQDLQRMAKAGKLKPTDTVKKTETGKWMPARAVKGLTFGTPPKPVNSMPADEPRPPSGKKCPACHTALQSGGVLCVSCGFDLRTGKRHSPVTPKASFHKRVLVASVSAMVLVAAAFAYYTFIHPGSPALNSQTAGAGGDKKADDKKASDRKADDKKGDDPPKKRAPLSMYRPLLYAVGALGFQSDYEKNWFYDRLGKRKWPLEALGTIDEDWKAAMLKATEDDRLSLQINHALACRVFLMQIDSLWSSGQFQTSLAKKYVVRIKQLPREAIDQWQIALEAATSTPTLPARYNKAHIIGFLLQIEPFFKGDVFEPQKSKHFLARLQSISPKAIEAWAKAIDGRTCGAALALMVNDSLFSEDQFQERYFKEECEAFQRLNPK